MMDQETWFDAESAVKNRLANRIIKNRGPSNELDADTIKAIAKVSRKPERRPEKIAAMLAVPPCEVMAVVNTAPEEETTLDAIDDDAPESPLNVAPVDVQATLAGYAARIAEIQV